MNDVLNIKDSIEYLNTNLNTPINIQNLILEFKRGELELCTYLESNVAGYVNTIGDRWLRRTPTFTFNGIIKFNNFSSYYSDTETVCIKQITYIEDFDININQSNKFNDFKTETNQFFINEFFKAEINNIYLNIAFRQNITKLFEQKESHEHKDSNDMNWFIVDFENTNTNMGSGGITNDFHEFILPIDKCLISKVQLDDYISSKETIESTKKNSHKMISMSSRRLNSIYNVIVGMAIKNHGYDVFDDKNGAPANDILEILLGMNIKISKATIKSILNESYADTNLKSRDAFEIYIRDQSAKLAN